MTPAQRWMQRVAQLGCVICRRLHDRYEPAQVHHVAEGSSKRSDYAVAPLCVAHHDPNRSGSGFHGMGTEKFCKLFRVPWENEYGLLVWTNEDLAKHGGGR